MTMRQTYVFTLERLDTPTGRMLIVTDSRDEADAETPRVRAVDWEDHEHRLQRLLRLHYGRRDRRDRANEGFELREAPSRASASPARRALEAYFDGHLTALASLAKATNGTEFQRTVWNALCRIPVGRTISYQTLAHDIGRPSATRAVGLANGSNPISIIVPCHRVIGSNRALTGYGGGIERKRWLLAHEGIEL
jgi:methylated-DNA-[protein]-cysteine S-methyltransferase